ncbi:beta-N-acetylhexosaminidase [Halovenus marina]|uniref:beta-N-acetylhexosaminidase n=1 Tax=Halovenus marina TaxID=3396621 RepID=UPI003F55DD72
MASETDDYGVTEGTTERSLGDVIPKPVDVTTHPSEYELTSETAIVADGDAAADVAAYLADLLGPATGYDLTVKHGAEPAADSISLLLSGTSESLGEEGYALTVDEGGVVVRANEPVGLFWGVQSLRQVLPAAIESNSQVDEAWTIPGGEISDSPRFAYRGAHFDVVRHFFEAADLKQFIDYLVQYKINHFHLHLTDDQGWRIEIESWPKLTELGANTEVGGGEGGYYTQEEYTDIVEYAHDRFVTVVPEIDMPGHTNAALVSYAELNPDGEAAEEHTDIEVGISSLAVDKDITYDFIEDVFAELAELTPGPYLHLGGDEADPLDSDEYNRFIDRALPKVQQTGKRPVGWHEILKAEPPTETIGQYWAPGPDGEGTDVVGAVENGNELILSPASHTYFDLKYDEDTELGLDWAGTVSVQDAYDWDPGTYADGVEEDAVMGVESALWSETMETMDDVEFMLFPRLPALAERGWSAASRDWDEFSDRLATQGPRWATQDINFYRAPDIDWAE